MCLLLLMALAQPVRSSEARTGMDEIELALRLTNLERSAEETPAGGVRDLVRHFALDMVHAQVRVSAGRVIATYKREDWKTRPYFAVNYVRDDYYYLDQVDPEFQSELATNLHWVSIVKSLPERQLMFELAIDQTTFERLERDEIISFTCEIAGIIRGGKSVYSRLVSIEQENDDRK